MTIADPCHVWFRPSTEPKRKYWNQLWTLVISLVLRGSLKKKKKRRNSTTSEQHILSLRFMNKDKVLVLAVFFNRLRLGWRTSAGAVGETDSRVSQRSRPVRRSGFGCHCARDRAGPARGLPQHVSLAAAAVDGEQAPPEQPDEDLVRLGPDRQRLRLAATLGPRHRCSRPRGVRRPRRLGSYRPQRPRRTLAAAVVGGHHRGGARDRKLDRRHRVLGIVQHPRRARRWTQPHDRFGAVVAGRGRSVDFRPGGETEFCQKRKWRSCEQPRCKIENLTSFVSARRAPFVRIGSSQKFRKINFYRLNLRVIQHTPKRLIVYMVFRLKPIMYFCTHMIWPNIIR